MGILASVLPDSRRIALDVAGIERSLVERRREQQSEAVVAAGSVPARPRPSLGPPDPALPPQRALPRTARSNRCGTLRSPPRPAARHRRRRRVDTSRRPTLRVRARLPARRHERSRRRLCLFPARLGDRNESLQRRVQEPAEPNALPSPFSPTRFMPSFQSPVPIRGSPCTPSAERRRAPVRNVRIRRLLVGDGR